VQHAKIQNYSASYDGLVVADKTKLRLKQVKIQQVLNSIQLNATAGAGLLMCHAFKNIF